MNSEVVWAGIIAVCYIVSGYILYLLAGSEEEFRSNGGVLGEYKLPIKIKWQSILIFAFLAVAYWYLFKTWIPNTMVFEMWFIVIMPHFLVGTMLLNWEKVIEIERWRRIAYYAMFAMFVFFLLWILHLSDKYISIQESQTSDNAKSSELIALASIAFVVVGFGALIGGSLNAYESQRQRSESNNTKRMESLLMLNSRAMDPVYLEAETMLLMLLHQLSDVQKKYEHIPDEIGKAIQKGFDVHKKLEKLRQSSKIEDIQNYYKYMRNCEFFEIAGLMVRNTVELEDIKSRYGSGIKRVYVSFYIHNLLRGKEEGQHPLFGNLNILARLVWQQADTFEAQVKNELEQGKMVMG
ncbi:MAG: hypothetical protein ACXVA2_14895 [Mucilaginibacter sp.]